MRDHRQKDQVVPIQISRLPRSLTSFRYRRAEPLPDNERAFDLAVPMTEDWSSKPIRLCVVLQTVPGPDFKAKQLCSAETPARRALLGVLGEAIRLSSSYQGRSIRDDISLCVINWNAAKSFDLGVAGERQFYSAFSDRAHRLIKKIKPTHVFVSGDQAAASMLGLREMEDYVFERRGWVTVRDGTYWCHSLDIDTLISDKNKSTKDSDDDDDGGSDSLDSGATADLLLFVAKHLSHLLTGKHPFSLKTLKPTPVFINTMARFNRVMEYVQENDVIALDLETRNLSSYANAIYTLQLSFGGTKGYVIPIDHPKTPFNEEERKTIKKRLRSFLRECRPDHLKTIVAQNGKFDMRVLRSELNVDVIHHALYEITAGESLLDENLGSVSEGRGRYGNVRDPATGKKWTTENLRAILCSYQNDWYRVASFTKEDRNLTAFTDPGDKNFLLYAAMDVVCIYHIREMQLEQSRHQVIYDWPIGKYTNYQKLFNVHMHGHMSEQCHGISILEQHGSHVDLPYMESLLEPNSALRKSLNETINKLKSLSSVQAVNKRLLRASGVSTGSLFGGPSTWVFSLAKPAHRLALFIDQLKLEPVSLTQKKKEPQIDTKFYKTYKDDYAEVSLALDYQEITKLLSTYVKGWIKKLRSSPDGVKDSRFRASYRFFYIVTGRLASFDPNHQNIPSRGSKAKAIKRMFRAPKGYFQVRADCRAHEVRMWAIFARDSNLIDVFLTGLKLRQKLVLAYDAKERTALLEELKKKGDVHIVTVYSIFKVWVDKTHVLRHTIKGIVFGQIYGLGLMSLANAIRLSKIQALEQDLARATEGKKEMEAQLLVLREQDAKDFKEEAQDVVRKMWEQFGVGRDYLEKVAAQATERCAVNSWTGRKRSMFRVLTGKSDQVAAAQRRGKNGPIQGVASEIGMSGTHLAIKAYDIFKRETKYSPKTVVLFTRVVHDASYFEIPYADLIPFLWCYQYMATFGVAERFNRDYQIEFPVPPEIDVEVSITEDDGEDWDLTLLGLRSLIEATLDKQVAIGDLSKDDRQSALDTILAPARDRKLFKLLQQQFPLLNVKELNQGVIDQLVH